MFARTCEDVTFAVVACRYTIRWCGSSDSDGDEHKAGERTAESESDGGVEAGGLGRGRGGRRSDAGRGGGAGDEGGGKCKEGGTETQTQQTGTRRQNTRVLLNLDSHLVTPEAFSCQHAARQHLQGVLDDGGHVFLVHSL